MSNRNVRKQKLLSRNIGNNRLLMVDPDNVFWGITKEGCSKDSGPIEKITGQYSKVKSKLDIQMKKFRFDTNLTAIYIDPTDKCNANCSYCYIPENRRKHGKDMTWEELDYVLKKIAVFFKKSNPKIKPVIVFHAAEPLLVKGIIWKAITEFKDTFYFGIQTNALLLEKKDVKFLKEHGVGVGISLDSSDIAVNNRQRVNRRGSGNFDKAVRAIEWFDGYEGLNVICTVIKFNVEGLEKLVEFLHSKKVGCVLLNPVRLTREASWDLAPDQKVLTKSFIAAVEKAIELSKISKRRIIIGNFANIILGIVAPTARRLMCDISPCGGGRCFLTITASGNMIPCGEFIGLDGFSGGNIFEATISKAINSKPFKEVRSRIVEKIKECDICDFRNICGAPCPAELHSRGNMYQLSVFCEFYKGIIEYAFNLIAEDKVKYILREESLKELEYEYNLQS